MRRLVLVPALLSLHLGSVGCGDDTAGAEAGGTTGVGAEPGSSDEGAVPTTSQGSGDEATTGSETTGPSLCAGDGDCADDNECTIDRCGPDGVCAPEAVLSNACRPQITVDYPPRGATIVGQPGVPVVKVTGTVTSAAAAIATLTLGGEPVLVGADGKFSADMVAAPGGNTLDFNVTDAAGGTRRRVQSFLWSSAYRKPEVDPEQMVPDGLAFYLSQAALDDGDPMAPADDIATVLGIALANFDIAAVIDPDKPITSSSGYDVYLTSLSFGSTRVGLQARDGGLDLSAQLEDVLGDLFFDCTTWACELSGGDSTGGLSITKLGVTAETMIWVDQQGQVQVQAMNAMTDLDPNDVDIWSDKAWTNFLITIIEPFIMNGVVNDISSALNDTIDTQLGPALAGALNTLVVDAFFDLPNLGGGETIPVNLVTKMARTDFHDGVAPPDPSPPASGEIHQSGGGYFTKDVTPYKNDGVPGRVGCAAAEEALTIPRTSDVEVALADDLINQVLYGAWRGGLLEFVVPPELAGESESLEVIDFVASGLLAPTASDCRTPGELLAHIGDLRFDAHLIVLGKPMSFTAYSSMIVRLDISVVDNSVAVGISEVLEIKTDLTANEDEMINAEAFVISKLEEGLANTITDALGGGGLGGINLPVVDLSAQLGLPPNTAVLAITAESVVRQPGATVIEAHF